MAGPKVLLLGLGHWGRLHVRVWCKPAAELWVADGRLEAALAGIGLRRSERNAAIRSFWA